MMGGPGVSGGGGNQVRDFINSLAEITRDPETYQKRLDELDAKTKAAEQAAESARQERTQADAQIAQAKKDTAEARELKALTAEYSRTERDKILTLRNEAHDRIAAVDARLEGIKAQQDATAIAQAQTARTLDERAASLHDLSEKIDAELQAAKEANDRAARREAEAEGLKRRYAEVLARTEAALANLQAAGA